MEVQLINSEHVISEPYVDSEGRELYANVTLKMNHREKTFTVSPSSVKEDFIFKNTSKSNWQLWIATGKAIQSATQFAVLELGFVNAELPQTDGTV